MSSDSEVYLILSAGLKFYAALALLLLLIKKKRMEEKHISVKCSLEPRDTSYKKWQVLRHI